MTFPTIVVEHVSNALESLENGHVENVPHVSFELCRKRQPSNKRVFRRTFMQAIVVTFDRLATRLVGCYGNEWIETPNFDRLAATSTVFDNHFTDSVGPLAGHAWLTGRHAFRGGREEGVRGQGSGVRSQEGGDGGQETLGRLLREAGVASHLFAAGHAASMPRVDAGFDRVVQVAGIDGLDVTPADVPFAKLVQACGAMLRDPAFAADKRLIWLHAPEPGLPPEGFATLYFEDFEERGEPLADIPRDEWSRQTAVAAGSMSLVDHWLGELLAQIRSCNPDEPTLVLIAGARGRSWMDDFFAAAPAGRSDSPADRLRDAETKSPLLLSVQGDDRFAQLSGLRCSRFVQSTDLLPTLLDWFGVPIAGERFDGCSLIDGRSLFRDAVSDEPARTAVCFGDDDRHFGIRTADWNCLIRLNAADQIVPADVRYGDTAWPGPVQLFSKPEDIWDVTDLATQQPEVCEELVRQLSARRRGG
jgi:arylsulfatase A-like enzyme